MAEKLRRPRISTLLILSMNMTLLHVVPHALAETAQFEGAPEVALETDPQDLFWSEEPATLSSDDRAAVAKAGCPIVVDMFEDSPSSDNWDVKRMKPPERFDIQSGKRREGRRALAISLLQGDRPNSSGVHKHELWISNRKRCYFGTEIWYSFSFHVDGEYPQSGSTRWVIGQWKEESDGSPFLAQRFDNGVFHISVQRGNQREIIATAPGDYEAYLLFARKDFEDTLPFQKGMAPKDFDVMQRANQFGPSAFDTEAVRKAIIDQDISQFPFLADPENYGRIEGVFIEPSANPLLPNPSTGWVDMRYRVKGDRDGNGLIEVWANDQHIVRVTGKIGNDEVAGPTQYFKVGHYRDLDEQFVRSTIYFDRFRRSTDRANVD